MVSLASPKTAGQLPVGAVDGDNDGGPFVEPADQVEEQLATASPIRIEVNGRS